MVEGEAPSVPWGPLVPVLEHIAGNTAAMLEALRCRARGAPLYAFPSIRQAGDMPNVHLSLGNCRFGLETADCEHLQRTRS